MENARIDFDGNIIEFNQINIEVTIPSSPNFPALVPTRYVVELPENIYVDETHSFSITGFTRNLTFPPGQNEYYIDPITPVNLDPAMPFLIEFHSSNAGQTVSIEGWFVGSSVTKRILCPVGTIIMIPKEIVPDGYLECNGQAVKRLKYFELFNYIGTMYGPGDGSTTFNVPDYRGYLFRSWDHGAGNDPDASTRTNRGDGTTGDHVGTKQEDKFQGHVFNIKTSRGTDQLLSHIHATGADANGDNPGVSGPATYPRYVTTNPVTDEVNGTPRFGLETRPKNINIMLCIKN